MLNLIISKYNLINVLEDTTMQFLLKQEFSVEESFNICSLQETYPNALRLWECFRITLQAQCWPWTSKINHISLNTQPLVQLDALDYPRNLRFRIALCWGERVMDFEWNLDLGRKSWKSKRKRFGINVPKREIWWLWKCFNGTKTRGRGIRS